MKTLSPRQRDVLAFCLEHQQRTGSFPTYREIGDALGIASTNGVSDHVKALVRKGALKRSAEPGTSRGFRVPRPAQQATVQDLSAQVAGLREEVNRLRSARTRVCLACVEVVNPAEMGVQSVCPTCGQHLIVCADRTSARMLLDGVRALERELR